MILDSRNLILNKTNAPQRDNSRMNSLRFFKSENKIFLILDLEVNGLLGFLRVRNSLLEQEELRHCHRGGFSLGF